ncbi:hypothetical protein SHKM778_24680 [Streptomyces sp. KM77-8]|uniref:Uncharacterized protein n=1 Tax=Streptomyces haneummycinicus TaxID=3074435 RepID=A0AAT9HFY3_9ACTN
MFGAHPFTPPQFMRRAAELVVADGGEQRDLGAQPGGGHGLVAALPTGARVEEAARDGLTGRGRLGDPHGEAGAITSDNRDLHRHTTLCMDNHGQD